MSDTKHTPEPWIYEGLSGDIDEGWEASLIIPGDKGNADWHSFIVAYGLQGEEGAGELAEANARRIVACVNACAGMADPEAEIAKLKAEMEELREAAEAYMQLSTCYRLGARPTEKLFAALSKARAALERIKEV